MRTPKTHPLEVSYLVVGLVFLGIAGAWALSTTGVVDAGDVDWLIPLVLVVSGAVGLAAFAAKSLGRGRDTDPVDSYPDHDLRSDQEHTAVLPHPTEGDPR